jgi:hypothetical protein
MVLLSRLVAAGRAKVEVALDEGGLRCAWRKGKAYVPFALLADARIEKRALTRAKLVLVAKSNEELRLDVGEPLAIHRAIVTHLVQAPTESCAPAGLARGGRALDGWLDDVARRAGEAGYREAGVDHGALAALLGNEHASLDARAAAAFVLVGGASSELLHAVARAFVEHAMPPLVLLAAWLAPGGAALVPDDVAAEAGAFLTPGDAALAKRPRPDGDAARAPLVAAALAVALTAARATPRASQAKRRRLHVSANAGIDARWIGRTWAL